MKILLAEDETRTRERIARTLMNLDIVEEVFQADNGEIALDIITRENVDLIITDICMPKLSGLDVIRTIREKGDDREVIVMSGYNDFEYARTALKYNVLDYLLKPVNPIEIKTEVQAVAERIRKRSFETRNARTPFFSKLIREKDTNTPELLKEMADLNLPRNSNLYAISFITYREKQKLQITALQKELERITEENPIQNLKVYPFTYQGAEEAIIFMFDNYTEKNAISAITQLNMTIGKELEEKYDIYTTAISSDPVPSIGMLAEVSQYARIRTMVELDYSSHMILASSENHPSYKALSIEENLRKEIASLPFILEEPRDTIFRKISDVAYLFQELTLTDIKAGKNCFIHLKETVRKLIDVNDISFDISIIDRDLEALDEHEGLSDTYQRMLNIFSSIIEAKEKERIPISEKISTAVKAKIEANISNGNFTVLDAIEGLNYSENYIRYIFSNHEGMTIKEYMISRKMQRAKELLLAGIQIKKIAEMTGYDNQRYFARCFKAFVGLTPTEWRDRTTGK